MPRWLLAFAVASLAIACAGKHRPSVVATAGSGGATVSAEAESVPTEPQRPIDAGPDVQPLREDQATGQEILGGADGEGGPLADIHFEYNLATLDEAAIATLQRHAQWLQQHAGTKVTIEGHCDERGTVEYNLALGDLRAQSVREQLVGLGVSADRLTPVSYGKERPLDPGRTEASFATNRRAHFVVSR